LQSSSTPAPAKPTNIICGVTISTTAPTWRFSGSARGLISPTSEISPTPATLHLFLRDSVPQNIVSSTVGSFGYDRFLTLGSTKLGGGSLLYAGEFQTYDGQWVTGEDVRKFSGLMRYSQGTATNESHPNRAPRMWTALLMTDDEGVALLEPTPKPRLRVALVGHATLGEFRRVEAVNPD
jgi:hypothetical protein